MAQHRCHQCGYVSEVTDRIPAFCIQCGAPQQSDPGSMNGGHIPLLKRVFLFLEDGDFRNADLYCERVLDMDPECGDAYLGKLMVQFQLRHREDFQKLQQPIGSSPHYQKILRFGSQELKDYLTGCSGQIAHNMQQQRLDQVYRQALQKRAAGRQEADFREAAGLFHSVCQYRDSAKLEQECLNRAEIARKDAILLTASQVLSDPYATREACAGAIARLNTISGWRDADAVLQACRQRLVQLKAEEESRQMKKQTEKAAGTASGFGRMVRLICAALVLILGVGGILFVLYGLPAIKYNSAMELLDDGDAQEAYDLFLELGDYEDAPYQAARAQVVMEQQTFADKKVGDTVFFGRYEQDNNYSNDQESIEWIVLAVEDDKMLVLSKYALAFEPYEGNWEPKTWEQCSLRRWLNNTFIKEAFTKAEQTAICTTQSYASHIDTPLQDQVFLLSGSEIDRYCPSDVRTCNVTDYAKNTVLMDDNQWACIWWARPDSVDTLGCGDLIRTDGSYDENDDAFTEYYVRPAMWIALED